MRKILASLAAVVAFLSIIPLVTPTTTNSGTLTASATVSTYCDVQANPTSVNFGNTLTPGTTSGTQTTSVSQPTGNTNGALTISGQDWNFGNPPTMPVGATEWRTNSNSFAPLISTDASVGTLSFSSPTSVDLHVVVPANQAAASYTQIITFGVTC